MIWTLILAVTARTFFVSPTGDDRHDGHSCSQAWRSLEKVSRTVLLPGDTVILSGSLEGHLVLHGAGTPERPVVIRSQGERATIESLGGPAISAHMGGLVIRNLSLKGGATKHIDTDYGISLVAPGGRRVRHIRVEQVSVSGFGDSGISIQGAKGSAEGFEDVRIDHVTSHGNYGSGIISADDVASVGKGYAHRNFLISDCDVSGNFSGSGLVLSGVDGATVQFCRSNGNSGKGGGVGLWAWCARHVVFRYCISSGTRSNGGDGGGFDLDGGCVDCLIEHCLTYDNDGPGTMHCDYPSAPRTQRNVVRDSISLDDGRKAKGDVYGFGLVTWGSGLFDCSVEHNLAIVTTPDPTSEPNGVLFVTYIRSTSDPVEKQLIRGCLFRDNRVSVGAPGAAFVRNGLPKRAVGDVDFFHNAYVGAAPFMEGERRLTTSEWRLEYPSDAALESFRIPTNLRALRPRDLPGRFRSF